MPQADDELRSLPPRILTAFVPWARLNAAEFSYPSCALCGSSAYVTMASLVINWSEFFLSRCQQCGLKWRSPMPDTAFLSDLYAEPYFDVRSHSPELEQQVGIADATDADKQKRREITQAEVKRWRDRGIEAKDVAGRPPKLLEIGGGRGYLQRAARDAGFDTIGLEISPHGMRDALGQGLNMIPITLEEFCDRYAPAANAFDVIVFFDFLEHVTDPGRVLRMVRSILKDDGVVILRVPCIADAEVPRYHLIDHIFHFSERTLRLLLQREGFVYESQPSGRFPGAEGQIQNVTCFCKKIT